jgi:hypothetical protein
LVLAIGLVVDDAIIVVEAVEHHMDGGLSPRDAAYKAMEEVGGSCCDRTDSCISVYSYRGGSGHHWETVSAVCDHNRGFCSHLGLQRANA